jgi:hypothetical protein
MRPFNSHAPVLSVFEYISHCRILLAAVSLNSVNTYIVHYMPAATKMCERCFQYTRSGIVEVMSQVVWCGDGQPAIPSFQGAALVEGGSCSLLVSYDVTIVSSYLASCPVSCASCARRELPSHSMTEPGAF